MSTLIDAIENSSSKEYNFAWEGVNLMQKTEQLHGNRLSNLETKEAELNVKLSALKDHLSRALKHLKKPDVKEALDLSDVKETILNLWNEWKESLKTKDLEEYQSLKNDLSALDFSKLSLEELDDKLIPELEKVQRHQEFQYKKIPNELRMFIELFTILVEILKEFPKKFSELNGHINRSSARG